MVRISLNVGLVMNSVIMHLNVLKERKRIRREQGLVNLVKIQLNLKRAKF